ncbi:unnamed protein product [Auanema sp. JU1783]|nr:unnamed protein product [Auanema sp. JU1783]
MSPSDNYKKKIPASTLYTCPETHYFILKEYTDLSSLQDSPFFKYKTHLLDAENRFVIKDKETLKEARSRFFFYHRYDKTIYSIYQLPTKYLKHFNQIFYLRENAFINCVILIISGGDCAVGCYHGGEMVAHRRFHKDKSNFRADDNVRGSGAMNFRRHNAKEMNYDIRSLLSTWNHLLKQVKVVFYQGVTAQHDGLLSYFEDLKIPVEELPFPTVAKTRGLKSAYDELFQVTCHGTVPEFFKDLGENTLTPRNVHSFPP